MSGSTRSPVALGNAPHAVGPRGPGLRARLAALALCLAGCGAAPPPDVLLVVVDTLRADRLSAYGFRAATSPTFDALAARGVLFERAIAASGKTAPSTATIMTSRFVAHHSIGALNGMTRLAGEETLALRFRAAGYATGAFVGNAVLQRRVGLDTGFDVYDDELPDREENRPDFFERTSGPTTDRALAWLAEQPAARPVFLWVHYQDPHGPYTPPPPYAAAFPELVDTSEAPLPVGDDDSGWNGIPTYQRFGEERLPSQYTRRYAGEIAAFDAALARVLAAFEGRGRPLVVAFTADHGESFGEQQRWFVHGHVSTPELSRVPLALVAPGLAPGRSDALVHHVDLMPTLLELAGLEVPAGVGGLALGPALRTGEALPERTVFCDVGTERAAYRGDRYLRIWIEPGEKRARIGTFRWRPGAPPEPVPHDVPLVRDLAAYHKARQKVRYHGESLDEQDVARLRALGYVVGE